MRDPPRPPSSSALRRRLIRGTPPRGGLPAGPVARVPAAEPGIQLLGRITDLYFDGDMEASVANTGQVSSRITDLMPASKIVEQTWSEIEKALSDSRSRLG